MKSVNGFRAGLWAAMVAVGVAACSYDVPGLHAPWPLDASAGRVAASSPTASSATTGRALDQAADCLRTEEDPLCLTPIDARERWAEPAPQPASNALDSAVPMLRTPGLRSPT